MSMTLGQIFDYETRQEARKLLASLVKLTETATKVLERKLPPDEHKT